MMAILRMARVIAASPEGGAIEKINPTF